MSTIKKVSFFGKFLVCVYCGKSPFSGKFSVWDNMSFCLRIYMSTTIKLLSLADFEFVSLCLQPKSSFLWQIANFCQNVYNKKILLWQILSLCLRVCMSSGKCLPSLQIMSLYLHVYNQQVPSSGRFWVCVYVSACLQPKVPFSDTFSVCLNLLTMGHYTFLGHHWRSRRYVFEIFFSLIGLNLRIWMQF